MLGIRGNRSGWVDLKLVVFFIAAANFFLFSFPISECALALVPLPVCGFPAGNCGRGGCRGRGVTFEITPAPRPFRVLAVSGARAENKLPLKFLNSSVAGFPCLN